MVMDRDGWLACLRPFDCVMQRLMDMQFFPLVCLFDGRMEGWMDGWMDAL